VGEFQNKTGDNHDGKKDQGAMQQSPEGCAGGTGRFFSGHGQLLRLVRNEVIIDADALGCRGNDPMPTSPPEQGDYNPKGSKTGGEALIPGSIACWRKGTTPSRLR
jgi:hypothetical protein